MTLHLVEPRPGGNEPIRVASTSAYHLDPSTLSPLRGILAQPPFKIKGGLRPIHRSVARRLWMRLFAGLFCPRNGPFSCATPMLRSNGDDNLAGILVHAGSGDTPEYARCTSSSLPADQRAVCPYRD